MEESTFISQTLFDLSPDLLCFINTDGYFIRVNKALETALGYTKEELLAEPFLHFVDADYRERTIQQIKALAENKPIRHFKNCYRCSDGSLKWLSWNAFQLPDKTCFASARDITIYSDSLNNPDQSGQDINKDFNLSPDVICLIDDAGKFARINRASQELWGYNENELIGRNYLDLVHPNDREQGLTIKAQMGKDKGQTDFENKIRCKNGGYLPITWSTTWLPTEQLMFAVARDATQKESWKEQLQINEHRLLALIESGNDIILILSADGVYKFVSPSVKTILNSDPEFYLGKVTFQFIHPDDVGWVSEEFKAVLESDKPVYIAPFRFQIASGEWVWIETMATNRLNDPAIEGIVINAKDITKKRNQEQEKLRSDEQLKSNNERYSLALKATRDVIWDWNLETNNLSRDLSFEKLFGYSQATATTDAEKDSWEHYIVEEDSARVIKSLHDALNNAEITYWREEYRYLHADQAAAYIIDQGYIIRNADGKAVRMVGAMHDSTEEREKEQHILQQHEKLMEVALINSHELRRPVATILGLVNLLDKTSVQDQGTREIIDHLATTAAELEGIIQSINERIKS
jgi:PAS domain S-box-containing protein